MDLKKLGNIELLKTFLAMHYQYFDMYENELSDDPRIYEYALILERFIESIQTKEDLENLYYALFKEAQNRGLKSMFIGKYISSTDDFESWQTSMFNSPTYIREIEANNRLGGYDISYVDDEIMGFDYPVRNACKILTEKGYITYWSSANREDYFSRQGHVIKGKKAAYILIDHQNLTAELKEQLLLDGECNFWGIAKQHADDGSYYGIWSEIISENDLCQDISDDLSSKALALPTLKCEEHNRKLSL